MSGRTETAQVCSSAPLHDSSMLRARLSEAILGNVTQRTRKTTRCCFAARHLSHVSCWVCIDTCHALAAGYDLTTKQGFDEVFDEFDKLIGFRYLKGMHFNDSKKEPGSRVDRHASLGKGSLGTDVFGLIMNDKRFDGIPLILETPDEKLWPEEILFLKSLIK